MSWDDVLVLDVMQAVLQAGSPFPAVTKPSRPPWLGRVEPSKMMRSKVQLRTRTYLIASSKRVDRWTPLDVAHSLPMGAFPADSDLTFGSRTRCCCACVAPNFYKKEM